MTNSIITVNPEIQSGSPVFTGTRLPIKTLFDYLSTGETIETYLEDYPYISKEQIYELLSITGKMLIENKDLIFHENTN